MSQWRYFFLKCSSHIPTCFFRQAAILNASKITYYPTLTPPPPHTHTPPLTPTHPHSPPHSMDPYDRLVWDIWMPKLRHNLVSWSPKSPNPLIDLLELWMPLLPPWVLDNILDQLVLPRLQQQVEDWDPTTDPVPIHSWIQPWLPLMGECVCVCVCVCGGGGGGGCLNGSKKKTSFNPKQIIYRKDTLFPTKL